MPAQHQRRHRGQQPGQHPQVNPDTGGAAGGRRLRPRLVPRPAQRVPLQRDGPGVQHHRRRQDDRRRQQEVHRHQRRVQLGQHHDAADDGLRDDAKRQHRRQPHQVGPAGRARGFLPPLPHKEGDERQPGDRDQREVQQPVAELDPRVEQRLAQLSAATALDLVHAGQSGQPSPDEESRTAAPVAMTTALEIIAASAHPCSDRTVGFSTGSVRRESTRIIVMLRSLRSWSAHSDRLARGRRLPPGDPGHAVSGTHDTGLGAPIASARSAERPVSGRLRLRR